jgi:hypothetical protein
MPRPATVVEVLIASPSDAERERTALARAVSEWNSTYSRRRRIILQPLRWEHDSKHAYGTRPQTLLNRQLVRNADILLGVFRDRLGTPTGRYPSGTAEEIAIFRSKRKPIALYFRNAEPGTKAPPRPSDLQKFKRMIEADTIYKGFKTPEELRGTATNDLDHLVNQLVEQGTLADLRHNARDVSFWHTFHDRGADGKGVHDLIGGAGHRIVVTGGSLGQIIWRFKTRIRQALSRGVLVGLVMATPVPEVLKYYLRYSESLRKLSPLTQALYRTFCRSLSASQRERVAVCHTNIPLTHSIGLYDDQLFVSDFCIDVPAEECPSFSALAGSHAFYVYLSEVHTLLTTSRCVFGSGAEELLASIERSQSPAKSTPTPLGPPRAARAARTSV